jgi:hypothetical protein
VLPWSTFWDRNYFAAAWPAVRSFVTNNFVRGAVSGLGAVNVITGFAELATLFTVRERPMAITGHNPETTSYPSGPDAQVDR